MELRLLRYFLAVAREQGISKAAESLHVTQPTLSRQIMDLEKELGAKLLERSKNGKGVKLTNAGALLYERAEDIISLSEKTVKEFNSLSEGEIIGDVSIACAESKNISFLAECIKSLKRKCPKIQFHLYAGDSERALEKLDNGLFDFAVIVENVNLKKYNCLTPRALDRWGAVMRKDSTLAQKRFIAPKDLLGLPILVSRQALAADLPKWFGDDIEKLNIAATLDLSYNGTVLVQNGIGCLLTFDGLANTGPDSQLCFRPLKPELTTEMHVVWRRKQQFTPAAEAFLNEMMAANFHRSGKKR